MPLSLTSLSLTEPSLESDSGDGALVIFEGRVRSENGRVVALEIEHYPAMTERSIEAIAEQATRRWPVTDIQVFHRVGWVGVGELIVRVAVTAEHRRVAFDACAFVMDYLKTQAPFWKKEINAAGEGVWVEMKQTDRDAAARWSQSREQ
ncbi:MAG: hypothetical protein CVV10_01290 [Gammaproteobacteria bacterium HGW-Gammaproteobacteria-14]|nr:MAG: hypothetical protein CVV10_01290 [Gammaproteobacteria bacterium HGW-Gammaproteobacteria-14]